MAAPALGAPSSWHLSWGSGLLCIPVGPLLLLQGDFLLAFLAEVKPVEETQFVFSDWRGMHMGCDPLLRIPGSLLLHRKAVVRLLEVVQQQEDGRRLCLPSPDVVDCGLDLIVDEEGPVDRSVPR